MIWIIILFLPIYLFMGWVGARAHIMDAAETSYMEVDGFVTGFAIFIALLGPIGWLAAWGNATEQMARMHGLYRINRKGVSGNFARSLFRVKE